MAKRKKHKNQDLLVDIVDVKEHADELISGNQNLIFGVLVALAVLVGGIFAYNKFVKIPKQAEAVELISQAQMQFEQDSFALALTNPGGGNPGFIEIVENYGNTPAGNVANYYAGVSYLHLGQFDAAIDYLKAFKPGGDVMPIVKYGAIGDAYAEKGDFETAISYYKKAATSDTNDLLTPYYLFKLGLLYQHQGNNEEALNYFKMIKEQYPTSKEAGTIDKYIAMVQ